MVHHFYLSLTLPPKKLIRIDLVNQSVYTSNDVDVGYTWM